MNRVSGDTVLAAVVGLPVRHSLSPLIHNAWLSATGVDGLYIALSIPEEGFPHLIEGLRGGSLRGLNVTLPFKEAALACADRASARAKAAGAANLLLFAENGAVEADNTDGQGLLGAFADQAPDFDAARSAPVILGGGGAARGAAAALLEAGAPQVRLVNRTLSRATLIAESLNAHTSSDRVVVYDWSALASALEGAGALVNATSAGLAGRESLEIDLAALPKSSPVMDMVYQPLRTRLLQDAEAGGHPTVDGLQMLIRQAEPSFQAFFGRPAPRDVDVRALALKTLEARA